MISNGFIERSLLGVFSFLKESVSCEEYAAKRGFLQSLDARVKLLIFACLLIAVVSVRNVSTLCVFYSLSILLAIFSGIGLGYFLKRTWVFIPLFSLFIAIPALFSVFTPGDPLVVFQFAGARFIITQQGFDGAVLFVMRVATSVSLVVLMNLTTRQTVLLRVLRIFGIPQIFVMTLSMCYRYIYLFAEIIEHTYIGIKSRVGTALHYKKGQHIVAWKIANLWERSQQLNEEVYNAMLSRGYTGEPKVLDKI
jgi:cobalt/nickel transport system permease protein